MGIARDIVICLVLFVAAASATYVPYCASPDPKSTRHYAIGSRIIYTCPKGTELVGERESICLLHKHSHQGYWSSPRPICRSFIVKCAKLSNPKYGRVSLSGLRAGSSAYYQCSAGFLLVGQSTRICLPSGRWSGEAPTCRPIECNDLPAPKYGSVSVSGVRVGSIATYKCDDGFLLVGTTTRECLSNGHWSGNAPICNPIECNDLSAPKYGSVSVSGLRVGSTATYKCDDGFLLVGTTTRECLSNGQWSGNAPICKPIECNYLPAPKYGSVRVSGLRVGSTATYMCDDGFLLVGTTTRECLSNGQWSGNAPICKPIECNYLPAPKYGSVRVSGLRVGSTATYMCDDGFLLVGITTRECLSNGHWSGEAPTCKLISCPRLYPPFYGSVSTTGQRPGSTATYECSDGFLLVGESTRECLTSGRWSGKAPTCRPIKCPLLAPIVNGRITGTGLRVGSTATYECFEGFVLAGVSVRTCLNTGRWSGKEPSCEPVKCPDLPSPKYGSIHLSGTTLDHVAIYRCDKGFQLVGNTVRRCLTTGQWSGQAPVCEPRGCSPPPKPQYGYVTHKNTNVGAEAVYYCNKGYTLSGSEHRVCLVSGYWSGKTPSCLSDHY